MILKPNDPARVPIVVCLARATLGWFSALCVVGDVQAAQGLEVIELTSRRAARGEGMELVHVTAAIELPTGDILILDAGAERVLLTSADLRGTRAVTRVGDGPAEYRRPTQLLAVGGGLVAIVDPPNDRLLFLDSAAQPLRTETLRTGLPCNRDGDERRRAAPSATDAKGHWFARAQPIAVNARGVLVAADSGAIERWPRAGGCGRDTLGYLPNRHGPGGTVVGSGVLGQPGTGPTPFATSAQWAVSADGTVALVFPLPYRVDYVRSDRTRVHGAPILFKPVPVDAQLRQAWRDYMRRPVMGRHRDGQRVPVRIPFAEPRTWPSVLPPFLDDAVRFSPAGRLWIRRATAVNQPSQYDVFDARSPTLIAHVHLPPRTRVVGFSRGGVLAVMTDGEGVETFLRFEWPRASAP